MYEGWQRKQDIHAQVPSVKIEEIPITPTNNDSPHHGFHVFH